MFFLTGVARYLFVPLAEAVVFAMLASYVFRERWCRRWRCTCCAGARRMAIARSRNPFVIAVSAVSTAASSAA